LEIQWVVLVDGTKFAISDQRWKGQVKRIYLSNKSPEVMIQITNMDKELHIPYQSILYYMEA
jgi:hypothetical protein